MTAEQDGLDLAAVLAEHECRTAADGWTYCEHCCCGPWPCLPYRLAALALNLQGKVAREVVATWSPCCRWLKIGQQEPSVMHNGLCRHLHGGNLGPTVSLFALADPASAARCPQQTPFVALSEPTCTRPEGHEGAHLFTSYDGKTPLEMMPK